MLIWNKWKALETSVANLGPLEITCHMGRLYSDGTHQYSIWLSVPGSDSREIITVTKIRGTLADAQAEAERIFADLIPKTK